MRPPIRKAVLPVAGLGTRFLPATKAIPKEMIPLVDKPLVQFVVEEAVAAGIQQIIFVTGRTKRAIEDHFDVAYELEDRLYRQGKRELWESLRQIARMAEFVYVRQQEPLGLGHAVWSARNLVGNEPFAVLLGDDILDAEVPGIRQLIEVYETEGVSVLGIQEVPWERVSAYGILDAQEVGPGLYRVRDMVEKPSPEKAPSRLGVVGRYILVPEIFEFLEKIDPGALGEIQLTDALRALAQSQPVMARVLQGTRYDGGDKLGYLQATVAFGLKHPILGPPFREFLREIVKD